MNAETTSKQVREPRWFEGLDFWMRQVHPGLEAALKALLERDIELKLEPPRLYHSSEIEALFPDGPVLATVRFSAAAVGIWHFLIPRSMAAAFADIASGGDGAAPYDEAAHPGPLAGAWGQLAAALEGELSGLAGAEVTARTPEVELDPTPFLEGLSRRPVVRWNLEIKGAGEGFVLQAVDAAAETLFSGVIGGAKAAAREVPPRQAAEGKPGAAKRETPMVKKVTYEDFGEPEEGLRKDEPRNIGMLLDVSLPITIELGRTTMLIRDVLELGPGSVIELDKLSGEPVDLYINDRKFARGEVVVIDENFGVRITELVRVDERLKALQ